MHAQPTGWRGLKPVLPRVQKPHTADKTDLYEAARIAARVLNLPSSCRFVMEHLVGAYGGKLIEGRMLVWPSNAFLEERTGISERTIRFALARLLELGVIAAKDSPNGKRYSRMGQNGEIQTAYGFDLSPLLNRLSEWHDMLAAIKERDRERQAAFDDLTIDRRAAQEALRTIAEQFPEQNITALMQRALELVRITPRRSAKGSTGPAADGWKTLRSEAEAVYHAACAGNSSRHKDNNKYAPENPCNNGYETVGEETPADRPANLWTLREACPDAMEFMGEVRSDGELVAAAGRYRGSLGVSPSAWEEARREIGPLPAAATLVYVMQMQVRPAPGSEQIKNLGGYFRAMVRLIRDGRVNLDQELKRMRR